VYTMSADKASEKRKLCGDVESGVSSQEKDFTSSLIEITDVPPLSVEVHEWSEEGINLCVDLNSSPSNWANRSTNEVCVSENALALVSFAAPNNYIWIFVYICEINLIVKRFIFLLNAVP